MSQVVVPEKVSRSKFRHLKELWVQVLIAAVLGIAVGLLWPTVGAAVKPLNDWFILLVKMIVAPVIFLVVVHAVATMDNVRRVGKIGVKALSYFIAFSLLSMIIGLAVGNIFKPGKGMNIDPSTLDPSKIPGQNQETGFVHFVTGLIPDTLLSAFTTGAILPALFISIVFGFALNMSGSKGKPIVDFVTALQVVIFRIVGWVMKLAPFGTFGALAAVVANYGASSLANLGMLILVFTGTCVIYVFAILWPIMRACKLSLFGLIRYLKTELIIVLATVSSEAVLPQLMRKMENLGASKPVVGITIPAGFSFNLDGSAIYLTMATLFLAQATGIDLSWQEQLLLVGIMMLTSKGTAGIAGGAFVVLASSLAAIGTVPVAALALIVGVDRILNEGRVFINVLGNAIATIVVAKWDDDLDHDRATQVLYNAKHHPHLATSEAELEIEDIGVHHDTLDAQTDSGRKEVAPTH